MKDNHFILYNGGAPAASMRVQGLVSDLLMLVGKGCPGKWDAGGWTENSPPWLLWQPPSKARCLARPVRSERSPFTNTPLNGSCTSKPANQQTMADVDDLIAFPSIEDVNEILQSSSPPAPRHTTLTDPRGEDDTASLSGSARNDSGPDEAVFDLPAHKSSPGTSNASSDDEISLLESPCTPSHRPSKQIAALGQRSPFQNPSSVRAMQLDTTPPHLSRTKTYANSRATSTPRSVRSHRGTPSRIMNGSPSKSVRKEHPLVLLHVTLLPLPREYPMAVLESVLPPSILKNWELLVEKTTPTVLHRGVLIPHPQEDYDLLEERLLESLELKQPRILKCGHFRLPPEEEADVVEDGGEGSDTDDGDSELPDVDICHDCGRRIRDGRLGDAGSGSKRWDVKLFAANGLMRAGAWGAAWREMERVDVEILPWMEENMRRDLEARCEDEDRIKQQEELERKEEGVGGLDDERLREIYGQDGQSFMDGVRDESTPSRPPRPFPDPSPFPEPSGSKVHQSQKEVPLWELLRNYVVLMAQDRKNITIFLLSIFVLFLSMRTSTPSSTVGIPESPIGDVHKSVISSGAMRETSRRPSIKSTLSAQVVAHSYTLSSKPQPTGIKVPKVTPLTETECDRFSEVLGL